LKNFVFYKSLKTANFVKKLSNFNLILITLLVREIFNKTLPARVFSSLKSGIPICNLSSGVVKDLINKHKCGISSNSGNYIDISKKMLKYKNFSDTKKISMKRKCLQIYKNFFDKKKRLLEIKNLLKNTE